MLVIVIHVVLCIALIGIVLLQKGKGADIGATFGGAGSQTLFGSSGPSTLLGKVTTVIAILFMVTSLFLGYIQSRSEFHKSVITDTDVPAATEPTPAPAPATPQAP